MSEKKIVTGSKEFAESIIDTVREPLIALDQDLRVVSASRSFYQVFKVNPEETLARHFYALGNKQWDIPQLRELLETILPEKTSFDDYEVEHDFSAIGRRIMLLNARRIERAWGKERIILLAIEDITERRRLEDLLNDSEERYRRLFETASDGIVLLEKGAGHIAHANPAAVAMPGYSEILPRYSRRSSTNTHSSATGPFPWRIRLSGLGSHSTPQDASSPTAHAVRKPWMAIYHKQGRMYRNGLLLKG